MPSFFFKAIYTRPLINMLAHEAWNIHAIHHEQEKLDKLSVEGMSKGYQL